MLSKEDKAMCDRVANKLVEAMLRGEKGGKGYVEQKDFDNFSFSSKTKEDKTMTATSRSFDEPKEVGGDELLEEGEKRH